MKIIQKFKCDSCGSTQVVKQNSGYICAYCNADYIYTETKNYRKYLVWSLIFISIILLIIRAYQYDTPKENHINTVIEKEEKLPKKTSYITYDIAELLPSEKIGHYKKRQNALSKWIQSSEYEDRLNNGYYQSRNTYIAYQELNKKSYRRILALPIVSKKQKFLYTVKSSMTLEDFQKVNLNCEKNNQRLLSMSTYYMHKKTYYSGTWVSSWAYDTEVLRLKEYGIFPPKVLTLGPGNTFSKGYKTLFTFYIYTSNKKDAETHAKIYLIINNKEKILLGKGYSQYRKRGVKHVNRFGSIYGLNEIETFSLQIEGEDKWQFNLIAITMIDKMRNFLTYEIKKTQWLSENNEDIKKLNAKKSYSFSLDEMKRTN